MNYFFNRSALQMAVMVMFAATPVIVQAEAVRVAEFNIPAQPLGRALNELARQAGMTLMVDAGLTENKTSPALTGRFTVRDGLRRLLAGTALRGELTANGSIVVRLAPAVAADALQIGTLRVQGSSAAPGMQSDDEIEAIDRPYVKSGSHVHVSRENLERFRGTSPADIFKGVPGVQVSDARNSGAVDVNIRGMQGMGRVPVVIDGSVQGDTVYRGYAGVADRSYLDAELIGSVDISKGPTLAAQGNGAVGGLVKMETLSAADVLLPGERFGVRLRGGLQDNNVTAPGFNEKPVARDKAPSLLNGDAGFGSIVLGMRGERFELLAAHAHRNQGNYLAGKHGQGRYIELKPGEQYVNGKKQTVYTDVGLAQFYKEGHEVFNTANRTRSDLLKGTLHISPAQSLQLTYRHFDSSYGEIMPSQLVRNSSEFIPQWKDSRVENDTVTLRYKLAPTNQPLLNLKANLWHSDTAMRAYNGDTFRNPWQGLRPPGESCERCIDISNLTNTASVRMGGDLSNTSLLNTVAGALKLDYGASWQRESIGPGKGFKRTSIDARNGRALREGEREERSAFFNAVLAPTPWLSLEAGGRYSHFKTEDKRDFQTRKYQKKMDLVIYKKEPNGGRGNQVGTYRWVSDSNGELRPEDNPLTKPEPVIFEGRFGSGPQVYTMATHTFGTAPITESDIGKGDYNPALLRKDEGFVPSFGVNLKLGNNTTAYLKHTQGLRMPGLMESTIGSSTSNHLQAKIKPEHSKNWELGIAVLADDVFKGGDGARLKVVAFNNKTLNYLTRRPLSASNTLSLKDIGMAIGNADSYEQQGLEWQSSYDNGALFGDLSATYYHRMKICDSGSAQVMRNKSVLLADTPDCSATGVSGMYMSNHIPPKLSASLTLGGRLLQRKLTLGSRINYVSEPLSKQNPADPKVWEEYSGLTRQNVYKAYATVDLFTSYQLNKHTRLDLNIDNATNRYYFDANTLSMMPAPGRTVRASFDMRF